MIPRVSVVCSSTEHPVYAKLQEWGRYSELCTSIDQLSGGDILFLVSCTEMVPAKTRDAYASTLVLHASDLPRGRGWSPHIWAIVEGSPTVTVSLLEAEDHVDSGDIWAKQVIDFDGTELYDEINEKIFTAEFQLMDWAIDHFSSVQPLSQSGESTYYRRRTPADSQLDPNKSLSEQFDLLRVADPDRYPAVVELRGSRYRVRLDRVD